MSATSILLLGGTSFLGPAIVRESIARGHAVTLFNRGKTQPGLFPEVETLHGDRDGNLEALRGRHFDAVIDTSGYLPRVVDASASLLEQNVGFYLFVSSISVYADTSRPGVDETAPLLPMPESGSEDVRLHYGALKAACEAEVHSRFPGRCAVVRPGLIVGPGDPTDRFTYWPWRVSLGGCVLAPGDGTDPVQIVDVRDLAAFIVSLAKHQNPAIINATGPARPLTMRAMLEGCLAVTGSDASFVWVPAEVLEKHDVSAWSDLPAWVPARGDYAGFSRVSIENALDLGLRFRPLSETVKDTLDWFTTLPPERQSSLRAGLPPQRERELLAKLADSAS